METARARIGAGYLQIPVAHEPVADPCGGAHILRRSAPGIDHAPSAHVFEHGAHVEVLAEAVLEADISRREIVLEVSRGERLLALAPAGEHRGSAPGGSDPEVHRRREQARIEV